MLNLLDVPLSGIHLIDASAGTGKTYTISALIIRLILERKLDIRKILVVTFTEAATRDLKRRVGQAIRECLRAFENSELPVDGIAQEIRNTFQDRDRALTLLRSALSGFDEAAIYTIHGFCQRMLQEFALECACPFDAEIATDTSRLCMEIIEDFLRQNTYGESPLFYAFAQRELVPGTLYDLWTGYLKRAARILPSPEAFPRDLTWQRQQAESAYKQAFLATRDAWIRHRTEVEQILMGHKGLKLSTYKPTHIKKWIEEMDRTFKANERPTPSLFKKFEKFTMEALLKGTKKGHSPPEHPFFHLCQHLLESYKTMEGLFKEEILRMKCNFAAYMDAEYRDRKAARHMLDFDDLLTLLYHGIHGASGQKIAREIRKRFPAAMIDEFQDTDPVQYKIFKGIYDTADQDCLVYLIGDPKQSIYQFRGADIFSYARAVSDVEKRHRLDTNYRSEPGMVEAVNALFSSNNPFVFPWIGYEPVKSAGKAPVLHLKGRTSDAPMTIWILDNEDTTRPVTRNKAQEQVLTAITWELTRLLDLAAKGDALLKDNDSSRPLGPGDIAVLTRTNMEARAVRDRLAAAGIPCVLQSSDDVFSSKEAEEILRILQAIFDPGAQELVRAALVTRAFGHDAASLWRLSHDESAWGMTMSRFVDYNRIWNRFGVMTMFRRLLSREGTRARLLGLPSGERIITNYLHILEILHREELSSMGGPAAILGVLSNKILLTHQGGQTCEEHELRLESDGDKVQIVTIHKSKGLEYPVVFAPFKLGGTSKNRRKPILFHANDDPDSLTVALDPVAMDGYAHQACKEELAENLRLLYVATTRAINRCYLAWAPERNIGTSALSYLLSGYFQPAGQGSGETTLPCSSEKLLKGLAPLEEASGGRIRVRPIPIDEKAPVAKKTGKDIQLMKRRFTGRIDHGWRLTSFSDITRPQDGTMRAWSPYALETCARIEKPEAMERGISINSNPGDHPIDTYSILDFPRGIRAGIFLHDVMEHVDFEMLGGKRMPREVVELVSRKLMEHGFGQEWIEPVVGMLKRVLNTAIEVGPSSLYLSSIASSRRLPEMEFCYPLKTPDFGGIFDLLASKGLECTRWTEREDLRLTGGFMQGFIDLVFEHKGRYFIIDWKSDFLGPERDDYALPRLKKKMTTEGYLLQYHIYTLALHKYLANCLSGYDYRHHFGGIYYVFLRWVEKTNQGLYGIYYDRPSLDTVEAMERLLFKE